VAEHVLLADVGNSRVKLRDGSGVDWQPFDWRDGEAVAKARTKLGVLHPSRVVIASTSPQADGQLMADLWTGFECHQVSAADLPLEVVTSGTGIDRLLSAWFLFEQTHRAILVADCGTAFTLDLVDANGCFRGGAIGAGLSLQEQALASACPHLCAPIAGQEVVPIDTASAVFAGTSGAMAAAIEGLAASFEQRFDCVAKRFICGGDAPRMASLLPTWEHRESPVLEALSFYVSDHQSGA